MGFFDRLFSRAPAALLPPQLLRERLFDAVHARNRDALARLCTEHEASILEHFPAWKKLPPAIREDPERFQYHGQGLAGIARYFAETRKRPELLDGLEIPPDKKTLALCQESFQRADELMRSLEFEEALALLAPAEGKLRGFSAGQTEALQGLITGKMAQCHLESGRAEAAIPLYRRAVELSRTARDKEGVATHLSNLYEAHRYIGQTAVAASVADECAVAFESMARFERGRRFRKVADIVRRGEPLCRVMLYIDGAIYELDEIPPVIMGDVDFLFSYNRMFLARSAALVERGRKVAAEGRFEEALSLFREAHRIDPLAPGPLYEEAGTLLLLQRASEAVASYDKVEAIAPGWFHCRADRWVAAGVASGRIPHSTFMLLHALGDADPRDPQKHQLARQGITEAPEVPAFHLYLGMQLSVLGQHDEAREVFAEGLRLADEPDLRSRLLVQSSLGEAPSIERERKLLAAMEPGGNLVAAAMAALMLHERPRRADPYRPRAARRRELPS